MKLKTFLFTLLFVTVLNGGGFAQTDRSGEEDPAKISGAAMEYVVRRILSSEFKPSESPKIVQLLDRDIESSWLPKIENVQFVLVQKGQYSGDIYFFTEPAQKNGIYNIGFGYGDPWCNASGSSWRFRLKKSKVKLWFSGGFGSGCGDGAGSGSGSSNRSEPSDL